MSKATRVVIDGVNYPLDDTTAVDFSEAQSLSAAEKQQARTNIGAGDAADITTIQTLIGNTALPTTAQTITGAIAEHETDISGLESEIGDTVLPTTAQTITGAIAEHETDISGIESEIGNTTLPTTAQTLTGAIAEHETDISGIKSDIGAVPSGSNLQGEVDDLKSAIDVIDRAVTKQVETQSETNSYYIAINELSTSKKYELIITIGTTGNYTIQLGTGGSTSQMIDTLATNQQFVAGESIKFYEYTPSSTGVDYIRLSSNTVTWSVTVNEIISTGRLSSEISTLDTELSNAENKIGNTALPTTAQTITGAIAEHENDISGIDTKVGNVPSGSTLQGQVNSIDDDLDELFDEVIVKEQVTLSVQTDGYYGNDGSFTSTTGRRYAKVENVSERELYSLDTKLGTANISAIVYFNGGYGSSYFKGKEKTGTGTSETVTDYEFTIPADCDRIVVQSATATAPVLYKITNEGKVPKFYTKVESDARYELVADGINGYGVKWNIIDNDDIGSRCGKATGLSATIGIGSANGSSDFDSIYPWSEMKRCNININANGAEVVTYEGETGFALDGTNGDVYVRIPKFTILREIKDGYEYHIIGVPGAPVHEAFVEDGEVLDEIFVGAFEGTVVSDVLHSYGGKIPTANLTGSQYLTAAKANDADECTLYDMRCVDALWNLMAVEFGCRNTNHYIGYGYADYFQPVDNGIVVYEAATDANAIKVCKYGGGAMTAAQKSFLLAGTTMTVCDTTQANVLGVREIISVTDSDNYNTITFSGDPLTVTTACFVGSGGCKTNFCETATNPLNWHTGRPNFVNNSTLKNPVRYRWIENFIGSLWHHLPDVTFNYLQAYMCKDMKDYEFGAHTGAYKPVGKVLTANADNGDKSDVVDKNYWITSLVNDTFAKALLFGDAYDKSLTSVKAFGGYYYLYNQEAMHIVNGGGFDHAYRCNPLTNRAWLSNNITWYLYGARLIRKHIG